MFDEILQNEDLSDLRRELCDENDVCVEISETLSEEQYIILQIDAYYHSARMHCPPPSIDCLIIVKCDKNQCYDFYLVELKNINSPKRFDIKNIVGKFETTLNDFLGEKFADIFQKYCINKLKMYFVSDACRIKRNQANITESEYKKKILNTKLDALQSLKPFQFRNKIATIEAKLPNPMVEPC